MSSVVLDLEWNTGLLGGEHFEEIVEIGAVKVDGAFSAVDAFSRLVRPGLLRRMNPFIRRMLPFSMKDLRDEAPFRDVAAEFLSWCGKAPLFITWSTNDYEVLARNLERNGFSLPKGTLSYDLQAAYAYCTERSVRNYSLRTACGALGIRTPETGRFHDAYFDALCTSGIGRRLKRIYSVLPSQEELERFHASVCRSGRPESPPSGGDREMLLPENRFLDCPVCGTVMPVGCWYRLGDGHFSARIICGGCGSRYYPEFCRSRSSGDRGRARVLLWGEGRGDKRRLFERARALGRKISVGRRSRLKPASVKTESGR